MTSESKKDISRRHALAMLAVGSTAALTGVADAQPRRTRGLTPSASAPPPPPPSFPPAFPANHTEVPLPFAPGSLNGISERMITSHHDNNYGAAVRNLNRVEQELARIGADTPAFVVAALRDRELTFRNSKTLHEAYFANLGGDGRRSGAIEAALATAYGSSARWEEQIRATAMGLGGGSGWAILSYELETGALRTIAASNHTQMLATSVPLLVLDMYEHAYQMDFGAATARYIDAFFANVKWDEVNRRLESAGLASAALRRTPS